MADSNLQQINEWPHPRVALTVDTTRLQAGLRKAIKAAGVLRRLVLAVKRKGAMN